MNIQQLKKFRNFKAEEHWNGEIHLKFKHSDSNIAREVLAYFKELGADESCTITVFNDVNRGKAMGGYHASGSSSKEKAIKLQLI